MKYMLLIYVNPATLQSFSEEEMNEIFRAHEEFQKVITESGEMVNTKALADVSSTATVRVRDGATVVTDGPYLEAKEHFAGYYLVDCERRERAIELAAMIPDAKFSAMEVRAVLDESGMEM